MTVSRTENPPAQPIARGIRIGPFQFSPGLIPTLATLVFAVLLVKLGFWQLHRAHYKEALLQRMAERSHHPVESLASLERLGKDVADFPVRLHGRYLNKYNLLLDNRVYQQVAGYDVLTPFLTQGKIVLINRGWIPEGQTRAILPPIPAIHGEQTLDGTAAVPNPNIFILKDDNYNQVSWPFLIQKIDLEKTATLFDHPVEPFVLQLKPDKNSHFVRVWHSNFMRPERHYGYAFQWFSLCVALIVIYLTVNTRRIHKQKQE